MSNYKTDSEGRLVHKLSVSGDTLKLRKPKGRDVREIERISEGQETSVDLAIAILMMLSGQSEDYFLDLDGEDLKEAIEAVSSFRVFSSKAK